MVINRWVRITNFLPNEIICLRVSSISAQLKIMAEIQCLKTTLLKGSIIPITCFMVALVSSVGIPFVVAAQERRSTPVNGPENANTHTKFYERHRYGGRTEKKQQQQNQQMDDIHGIIISIKMRILCSLPCAAQCDQFLFFSTLQVHLVFG